MSPSAKSDPKRAIRLLLKAIKNLSEREQSLVLEHLLLNEASPTGSGFLLPYQVFAKKRSAEGQRIARAAVERMLRASGATPTGEHQMVPVRFSEDQYHRLKAWCEKNGFSMAVVVRGLVEKFLEGEERRAS